MQKPIKIEPEGIVSYFASRLPIEAFRAQLRNALPRYEACAFGNAPPSSGDDPTVVMLDLLAMHKGWFGYLDDVWEEFEAYVLDDVCQTATYAELHAIYSEVIAPASHEIGAARGEWVS